ncbi:MAG TPA: hypothetical protein VN519_15570 [Bryobacteraceae bacterium]|nr:hypothetical protein [Bryobacteraceae bacterium]
MRNVTFSADAHLIEEARLKAKLQNTTLNQAFRDWLADYTRQSGHEKAIDALYKKLSHVNSGGRKYTRHEMNER